MDSWNSLYNKQPTVMKILKQALQKNRVAHAYIYEGMRGTGKKEVALYMAKSLFCEAIQDEHIPCNQCNQCQRINNGNHPDLHIIEPDGASIKKDQIIQLQQEFSKKGVESERKVYIINHIDKTTVNAANSLLKFLEEPNPGTVALLLTENIQQVLPTIISRSQHVKFSPLSKPELIRILIDYGIKPDKAPLLAHLTNSDREAQELHNNDWFLQAEKIVLKLYQILSTQSVMEVLLYLQSDFVPHFKEREQIEQSLDMLIYIYRDILYIQMDRSEHLVFPKYKEEWQTHALRTATNQITSNILAILETKKRLHSNVNTTLLMEQLVMKLKGGLTLV